MKHTREKCGCVSERGSGRERYAQLCPAHRAEFDELHTRHHNNLRAKREREEP